MKAELDKNGMMVITPETPIESYALKCWTETALIVFKSRSLNSSFLPGENCIWRGRKLLVNTEVPAE